MTCPNLIHLAWVYPLTAEWANNMNSNACAVDWSRMATIEYGLAATNTRKVANQMIKFMNVLIADGMRIESVSVAGHSLGAHVAGFFGAGFKGRVYAIFGKFFFM